MLFQQKVRQSLLEAIDGLQRWIPGQMGVWAKLLIGSEIVAMAAYLRKAATIPAVDTIGISPKSQEVVIDDSDQREAVGHDARIGEVKPGKVS